MFSSQAWNFLSFDINRKGAPKCLKNCPAPKGWEKISACKCRASSCFIYQVGVEDDGEADVAGKKATPDGSEARAIIVWDNATLQDFCARKWTIMENFPRMNQFLLSL